MRATALVLLPLLAGCRCGTSTHSANGDLQLSPQTVDFGTACVKPTQPGLTVAPAVQNVTLQNTGVGQLGIASLVIDGGSGGFTLTGMTPSVLASGQMVTVPISFLPASPGPVSAALVATDTLGNVETAALSGTGSSNTPEPIVLLHCPGGFGADGGTDRCYDINTQQTSSNPLIWFPDTAVGSSATMTLVVANTGCADLNVSGADAGGAPFGVDAGMLPFTLSGGSASANLPTQAVQVVFAPTSQSASQGTLTLSTNVPGTPDVSVQLLGLGTMPNLELCTTVGSAQLCSSPSTPLTCDFSASTPCTGNFVVTNAGQAALQIDALTLADGDPQFHISSGPASLPYTLAGNATLNVGVTYSARAQFDSDVLVVTSSSGTLRANVQGGLQPTLVILPATGDLADDVNFNRNTAGVAGPLPDGYTGSKTFQISNSGSGPLVLQGVYFRDTGLSTWPSGAPYPYYALVPPDAGVMIAPGNSLPVPVTYTDPPNGGPSGGSWLMTDIEIDSNDPLWPKANGGKTVTVEAKTPCNPNPVAVLNGPSTSVAPGSLVTLDGSTSYDIVPDGNGSCSPGVQCTGVSPGPGCPSNPISHWEWSLFSGPTDAGAVLTPTGMSTSPTAQLQVGTCSACTYVVRLTVFDDTPPTTMNPNGLPSTYQEATVIVQ